MKSKKTKGNNSTTTSRSSEEDLSHGRNNNAFSFLKNRFFPGGQHHKSNEASVFENNPRTSTSSAHSANEPTIHTSLAPCDTNNKALSRSFDEPTRPTLTQNIANAENGVVTPRLTKKRNGPRPVSVMGMEGLSLMQLQQQNQYEAIGEEESIHPKMQPTKVVVSNNDSKQKNNVFDPNRKLMVRTILNPALESRRASFVIIKEGYLYKKTDFKPFHKQKAKLDRGWKLYKVVLRGHKLYLYKLTSESSLRSLFPSPHHGQQLQQLKHFKQNSLSNSISNSSISSNSTTNNGLSLMNKSDFVKEAQQVFFPLPVAENPLLFQGLVCMELNRSTMQTNKKQVYLILCNDGHLYNCIKEDAQDIWKIDWKMSLQGLNLEHPLNTNSNESSTNTPASPSSFTSIQSDPFNHHSIRNTSNNNNNSHSNGLLLFSISHVNRPTSILGLYSTQYRELAIQWASKFKSYSANSVAEEDDYVNDNSNDRMYDATQRSHPDLFFRNDQEDNIVGGTLTALVHELLHCSSFEQDETEKDDFLYTFLSTHSTFTNGARLLKEIEHVTSQNTMLFEHQVLNLFTIWCRHFPLDVMGDVATGMISVLDNTELISDRKEANKVKELVLKTVTEKTISCTHSNTGSNTSAAVIVSADTKHIDINDDNGVDDDDDDGIENITAYNDLDGGKRRDSINLSNLLITGLTSNLFLSIDPSSFAQQIYIFHVSKHKQYATELMNPLCYLPRPQISVQMLNSLLFTTASPHFLTRLIRHQVLIEEETGGMNDCSGEKSIKTRSRLLEHWIRIGLKLLELGDMTGWCAVALGVCSVGIVRLTETWKAVDRTLMCQVQHGWVRILMEYGLFAQAIWSDDWSHDDDANGGLAEFSKVLDTSALVMLSDDGKGMQQQHVSAGLPFFGTVRQAVDRYRRHTEKTMLPHVINFEECKTIYHTITKNLEDWKNSSSGSATRELIENSSMIPAVGPLQSFFEHSVTDLMSVPHDYKYLQECSLACEPRLFGQAFDKNKFNHGRSGSNGLEVAPPSNTSLVFPSILESCSLLDTTTTGGGVVSNSTSSSSNSSSGNILTATDTATATTSASTPALSNILTASSFKKPHPLNKMGSVGASASANNVGFRSMRSFMEDDRNIGFKKYNNNPSSSSNSNSSLNVMSLDNSNDSFIFSPPKNHNSKPGSGNSSHHGLKAIRRRTYSFPPGGDAGPISSFSSKYGIEADNNRTWLGSLISNKHHRSFSTKALIDAHQRSRAAQYGSNSNGEIMLAVQNGELVYKASAILKNEKSTATASSDSGAGALKKTESIHSIDFLKKDETEDNQDALLVSIKAGYLERLVEALVYGVTMHEETLKDQWQMMSLAEGIPQSLQPNKVAMDEEEYINAFFVTYRIHCSSAQLLDMLLKKFMDAKSKCKYPCSKRKNSLMLLESYFTPSTTENNNGSAATHSTTSTDIESHDWKKIAAIQLRVLDLLVYWGDEHAYDFVEEIETTQYIGTFLKNAKKNLNEWRLPLEQYLSEYQQDDQGLVKMHGQEVLAMATLIEQRIKQVRTLFIQKSMSPCYDTKALKFSHEVCRGGVEELYRHLLSTSSGTKKRFNTTLQLHTSTMLPLSISTRPRDRDSKSVVDNFSPQVLLEQVDKAVHQLFKAITMQDWIQTFDVFEAQLSDLYAWLPARKPSRTSRMFASLAIVTDAPSSHVPNYHVSSEEVTVSDIFTAIEEARRSVVAPSAFSDDDLLLAFPSSIQYLYCMHYVVRSWVMNEIASLEIDSKTRVLRIEKFLQMIAQSKISNEKMALFPELKKKVTAVPGFVEYAIASALVSPEVRLFTKAWHDVAMQHGHASLDTLESLLAQVQKQSSAQPPVMSPTSNTLSSMCSSTSSSSSDTNSRRQMSAVVPSLGWIFERMKELCFHLPDTLDHTLINFDKHRCAYQFLQLIMNVQIDLDDQQQQKQTERPRGISMSFLLSPNSNSANNSWKDLRDVATKENKKQTGVIDSGGLGLRSSSSKSHNASRTPVFQKLVTEQLEKLKRDFKERDRVDKEWLTVQHKLQKKQLEQARLTEKQDRKLNSSNQQPQGQQSHNSVMPRINSFLRGLRPHSMINTPIPHLFPGSSSNGASSLSTTTTLADSEFNSAYLNTTKASTVINLIHSTTSIASTYTKRDFVFRIVTEEGAQYLFQGMHRDDMTEWMQNINNSAREGAVKRQSVLAADSLDGDNSSSSDHRAAIIKRSRNHPNASNRTFVYGVSLEMLMMPEGNIPVLVEKCIREIEQRGLEEVGIYRVAGTGSVTSALKAAFNKDVNKVDLSDGQWADINVVADAFKQFLRELPEPLLTYTYYDEFITASASEDHDERVYLIKKIIKRLPYWNYSLLKRIIEHFVIVTDFEATNHMYATNLAIVFGPTLLQPTPGPASFATTMSNLGHHQNIVKYLILNYHYLFDVESDEVETPREEEQDKQQDQVAVTSEEEEESNN